MMTPEEISRLEYKRKFLLQNIADVKREWYKLDEYREKLRFLFMTAWFGTTAIYLKENNVTWSLSILLFIITAIFFWLELYYEKASQIRLLRICHMEDWLMQAPDDIVLNMQGPLSDIVPTFNEQAHVGKPTFWEGRFNVVYVIFMLLSVLIKLIFSIPGVT